MTQQFGQGFENLEERTLLAANVTAVLLNGTLTITGSTTVTADNIDIYGDGVTGNVVVDVNSMTGLTVTGGTDLGSEGTFVGVKNIVVNAGAGADNIDIWDIKVIGNVTANGGTGVDDISVSASYRDTYIGGNLTLNGGGQG